MTPVPPIIRFAYRLAAAAVLLCLGTTAVPLHAKPAAAADPALKFDSPEAAVQALVAALKANDHARVNAIFGPGVKDLLSGDPKQDAIEFAAFAKSVGEFSRLSRKAEDRFVLNLGDQNWPFPIPLVQQDGEWFFDTAAGREEIINRRIGEDEMNAIGVCQTYLEAQHEYAGEDRAGDGVFKYAQKIRSTPGQRDGLYWPEESVDEPSPLGPLVAEVRAEGYGGKTAEGTPQPFMGYHFKILTAQGAAAPGGAYNYIINGNMIAGFALVAYPAHWGESGVMTFIINHWGKVYECNLGADSAAVASAMTEFNPDGDWKAVSAP
jgi:hypothetical protein